MEAAPTLNQNQNQRLGWVRRFQLGCRMIRYFFVVSFLVSIYFAGVALDLAIVNPEWKIHIEFGGLLLGVCAGVSAYVGHGVEFKERVGKLMSYSVASVFFFTLSIPFVSDFGGLDIFIAWLLSVVCANPFARRWMAHFLGITVHSDEKVRVELMVIVASVLTIRAFLIPVLGFLNSWAWSEDEFVVALGEWNGYVEAVGSEESEEGESSGNSTLVLMEEGGIGSESNAESMSTIAATHDEAIETERVIRPLFPARHRPFSAIPFPLGAGSSSGLGAGRGAGSSSGLGAGRGAGSGSGLEGRGAGSSSGLEGRGAGSSSGLEAGRGRRPDGNESGTGAGSSSGAGRGSMPGGNESGTTRIGLSRRFSSHNFGV